MVKDRGKIQRLGITTIQKIEKLSFKEVQFSLVKTGTRFFLNIYGPSDYQDIVGKILGERNGYLQHPFFIRPGMRYENPQYLHRPGQSKDMTDQIEQRGKEVVSWSGSDIRGMKKQRTKLRKFLGLQ